MQATAERLRFGIPTKYLTLRCSLIRLLEEVQVHLDEVHPDIHSLFFIIAARRGLTSHASGPSQTPSPESRGVSDLSTAGELPRVQMRACGPDRVLKRYMYDSAVSHGAAERTEGVVVARLVRVHTGPRGGSPRTSSKSSWKLETISHPVGRDGANTATMGASSFSAAGGIPTRSFLHGVQSWLDSESDEYAAAGVEDASGCSTPARQGQGGPYN
jgi:hypothetical protein